MEAVVYLNQIGTHFKMNSVSIYRGPVSRQISLLFDYGS